MAQDRSKPTVAGLNTSPKAWKGQPIWGQPIWFNQ